MLQDDGNADPSITRTSLITRDLSDKQQQPEVIFTSDTLRKTEDEDFEARNMRSLRTQKSIGGVSGTGTLPRPAAIVPNHLTANEQAPYDDDDGLNRKSSNKSSNSSRSNDSAARRGGARTRTDHEREDRHRSHHGGRERDHERGDKDRERDRDRDWERVRERDRDKERDRRNRGGEYKRSDSSSKRQPKPTKPTQEESFDIYESLSESPV